MTADAPTPRPWTFPGWKTAIIPLALLAAVCAAAALYSRSIEPRSGQAQVRVTLTTATFPAAPSRPGRTARPPR